MNILQPSYKVREKQGYLCYNSKDVYKAIRRHFNPLQEEFFLLPMQGQEILIEKLFVGGVDSASGDPKIIFHKLLTKYPNCAGFFIAHNHPSGNIEPSGCDVSITEKIKLGGELLDCKLIDHIIFSNKGYFSFGDAGKL